MVVNVRHAEAEAEVNASGGFERRLELLDEAGAIGATRLVEFPVSSLMKSNDRFVLSSESVLKPDRVWAIVELRLVSLLRLEDSGSGSPSSCASFGGDPRGESGGGVHESVSSKDLSGHVNSSSDCPERITSRLSGISESGFSGLTDGRLAQNHQAVPHTAQSLACLGGHWHTHAAQATHAALAVQPPFGTLGSGLDHAWASPVR